MPLKCADNKPAGMERLAQHRVLHGLHDEDEMEFLQWQMIWSHVNTYSQSDTSDLRPSLHSKESRRVAAWQSNDSTFQPRDLSPLIKIEAFSQAQGMTTSSQGQKNMSKDRAHLEPERNCGGLGLGACGLCKQVHLGASRPNKLKRKRIKAECLKAAALSDLQERMAAFKRISEAYGSYVCRVWQAELPIEPEPASGSGPPFFPGRIE
eukprot:TRINITY_DN47778_c0_g1_i1.p1 TRINITY_DN47778_c0_g1~~TRINITY_DN47778_c0_g1_i1.p1  ORF type:complete len:208 (+),score=30.87 TRINITY_DN47778_c0_g1_i1:39-662(+)